MAVFVLVHGAYHGGWCWRRVAGPLRERGHTVHTPTLTGLGDRAHLLTAEAGLHTMIDDVVGVFEAGQWEQAIIVGHSFGALPTLGALPRIAHHIARVVILDGIVVPAGSSGFSGLDEVAVAERKKAAAAHDGLSIPPPPAEFFGVTKPDDVEWVTRRLTPHPLRSYLEPLPPFDGPLDAGLPVVYLRCTEPVFPGVATSAAFARAQGWTCRDIPAAHDAMITHPDRVVAELSEIAKDAVGPEM
ncbi:alpha/beta fold hydrolase [Amycolatopsis pithecellobii]|uniref:Alpha/beta fold hydrolase n=1 Tax=Amycolatopsis pithecellobii TaxID=664692 RepID=A0A6N7ZBL4_9PSEU|nr:alpha/beta fold hydrolase [Amycolatopsis pithecellobii]MTD59120.1 alpha/beta fold hydrolase [Amycolatopsis pithecellobii]